MLTVRAAELEDVKSLAPRLRQADLDEIQAASGSIPEVALKRSFAGSDRAWVLVDQDGLVVAMFGVWITELGCSVWMLGSPIKNQIQFLRSSRVVIDWLILKYGQLSNFVDSRNTVHIRWLKWLGFKFPGLTVTLKDPSVPFLFFHSGDSPDV